MNLRVFADHEIVFFLGLNRSRALPVFHAFTGCDTVSSFLDKGTKSAWQTWIHFDDVTTALLACSSMSEDCQERIERFLVLLYGRSGTNSLVNEARKQLFSLKGQPMGALPPTQAALAQHSRLAI